MTVDAATVLSQLNDRVNDQLKAVTCKWLARHHHIPINVAKQILFAFVEQQGAQVCPTYYLSGIAKETGALTTQLATATTLEAQRARYAQLQSLHVYGVQPKVAVQDMSALWNSDLDQSESLYRAFLSADRSDDESGLQDKAVGAISCDACTWTAHPGPRLPLKQIGGTHKGDGEVPGKGGADTAKGGVATARGLATAGGVATGKAATVQQPASNAARPASKSAPAGVKGALGNLWSNAKGKSKGKQPAPSAPPPPSSAPTVPASAVEEEDVLMDTSPVAGGRQKTGAGRRRMLVDSDDDGLDEPEEPLSVVHKADVAAEGKITARKKSSHSGANKASEDAAPSNKPGPTKPKAGKKAPVPDAQPGGKKRRKVLKTHINDKGEEETVIEWVEEETEEDAPAVVAAALPAKPTAPAANNKKPTGKKGGGAGAKQSNITAFFGKK